MEDFTVILPCCPKMEYMTPTASLYAAVVGVGGYIQWT